jgi:replicative DNA helicase
MTLETLIVDSLVNNETFSRKVLPFLEKDYFTDETEQTLFLIIAKFTSKYNRIPTPDILDIAIDSVDGLREDAYEALKNRISTIHLAKVQDTEWMVDETERYCQDRAIFNALHASIQILNNKTENLSKGAIPELLIEALSICFDTNIGHDHLEDAEARYDYFHSEEGIRVPFDIDILNKITRGGLKQKTLNFLIAASGVGKTALMCHFAAHNLMAGKNVLYITLEMDERSISERVDANILDMPIEEFEGLSKEVYLKKIDIIKTKTHGKLIVKEYPTSSANASHFRHLLTELRIKKKFIPDIIYIDYLNICSSSRLKMNAGSYSYIKAIAEEIRALAVEFNLPIMTATQFNREGYDVSDVGLTATSESMGIVHTADLVLALISTEELEAANKLMIKQLKNRYNDKNYYLRFAVGIDRSRMKLYDISNDNDNEVPPAQDTGSKFKSSNIRL